MYLGSICIRLDMSIAKKYISKEEKIELIAAIISIFLLNKKMLLNLFWAIKEEINRTELISKPIFAKRENILRRVRERTYIPSPSDSNNSAINQVRINPITIPKILRKKETPPPLRISKRSLSFMLIFNLSIMKSFNQKPRIQKIFFIIS